MDKGNRNPSEEQTKNTEKVTDYDYERLSELEKMQNMLFKTNEKKEDTNNLKRPMSDRTQSQFQAKSDSAPTKKLIEHANFVHNFSEYSINPNDVVSLYFVKHHANNNAEENNYLPDTNFIPVTTNVVKKDKDTIEITRIYLYNDYYNEKPYSTEKIIIKRNAQEKENIFISFYEDKMKKTVTSISADSIYSKVVKFKSFRNPNELLFLQNIFHYKSIIEMYNYYKMMNKLPPKKDLVLNNLYYHEFMKNLI
jgi:hypothetical protein